MTKATLLATAASTTKTYRDPGSTYSILCLVSVVSILLWGPLAAGLHAQLSDDDATGQPEQVEDLAQMEAVERFLQLLERRPFHRGAFDEVTTYYAEHGRLDALAQQLEENANALSESTATRIVLARVYLRLDRPTDAESVLDAVDALPERLETYRQDFLVLRAQVQQQLGRNDAALQLLNEALEITTMISARFELVESLAEYHLRLDQRDEAASVLIDLGNEFPAEYLHRKRVADTLAHLDLHTHAVEQYRAILELVEDETDKRCEVLRQLGRSLEALDARDEAISTYAAAIDLLSTDHWLQRELHARVVALYRMDARLDDLVAYCEDRIQRTPEQRSVRILLAEVLLAKGDAEAAGQVFSDAVALFPNDQGLSQKRIQFLEQAEDIEGAIAEYERIISLHPEDTELYIGFGQFLAANHELDAAGKQWRYVLEEQVDSVSLARRLGLLFEVYGLVDDAATCYEQAIALAPDEVESYIALSRLRLEQDDLEQAIEVVDRASQRSPRNAEYHAALSRQWLALGREEAAFDAIERACETAPTEIRHQVARADVLVRLGRIEESLAVRRDIIDMTTAPAQRTKAIAALVSTYASRNKLAELVSTETARLENDPDNVIARFVLARAADLSRDFSASRGHLEKILEQDPANQEARVQLARIHAAIGDVERATRLYTDLIEANPQQSRQWYAAIADLRLQYGDRLGAITTLETMARRTPDNAHVLALVGEQMLRMDEPSRAIPWFEQCLALNPDRFDIRLKQGEALAATGDLESAVDAFRLAALQRRDRDTAAEALSRMRETAMQLGSLDTLLDELEQNVLRDPTNTLLAKTLAALLIQEYDYRRASELLDRVLRDNPRSVEVLIAKADLHRRLADFDESLEIYRRILRLPNIDRDYILGEMGKAAFESGRLDQTRGFWRQIQHRLYAGTLFKNNAMYDDAAQILREGVQLKPDDLALRRNLVATLEAAGRSDDALKALRDLLDVAPEDIDIIQQVAQTYIERGDRDTGAEIAARLFSASVVDNTTTPQQGGRYQSVSGAMMRALYGGSGYYGGGGGQTNLERAVSFFFDYGLVGELEDILRAQLELQPDNAVLKVTAARLFSEQLADPEFAIALLREAETAEFPTEHRDWLGQSTQQDYFRMSQYEILARKPLLRDQRLGYFEGREAHELTRDELVELAVIRHAQGSEGGAIAALEAAVNLNDADVLALSSLVDLLVRNDRFEEAEPYARRLVEETSRERERIRNEVREKVTRDVIRSMPIQLQPQITEDLVGALVDRASLGAIAVSNYTGSIEPMGEFRARLALATVCANVGKIDEARQIWDALAPTHDADIERWTMLADFAQEYEQDDLTYTYYEKALQAARTVAGDPLLQYVFGERLMTLWDDDSQVIDSSLSRVVGVFQDHQRLPELYDFLRDTEQTTIAHRIAREYELFDTLIERARTEVDRAREDFLRANNDRLVASVPYFGRVCKLAELLDWNGQWEEAEQVYQAYLADFPDEPGLWSTLSETAELDGDFEVAIEREHASIEARRRLARQARQWSLRQLVLTPAMPRMLAGQGTRETTWMRRWSSPSSRRYGYGSSRSVGTLLDTSESWLRVAQLYLVLDNTIAAGDALERALESDRSSRNRMRREVLQFVSERQLGKDLLPVLRTMAIRAPADEDVQLAFAESLEANEQSALARQVYERMIRRGVSDLGTLAQIQRKLNPEGGAGVGMQTLDDLRVAVAEDPDNVELRFRYGKALYYSLEVEAARASFEAIARDVPHFDGVQDLLIEIYTLTDDREALVEALAGKIARESDEYARQQARWRLVEELLKDGRTDDALTEAKLIPDASTPQSYQYIGTLLKYFGRHDEALAQFKLIDRAQAASRWGGQQTGGAMTAMALALAGQTEAAVDGIMEHVDAQAREASQYSGGMGYGGGGDNPFSPFNAMFVLYPGVADGVLRAFEDRMAKDPDDVTTARALMMLHRSMGRVDLADELLARLVEGRASDQELILEYVERAVEQNRFDKAIEVAEQFIADQPRATVPTGVPDDYAAMYVMSHPRSLMICRLGDLYWEMGDHERAMEVYRQIVDEKIDATRPMYGLICVVRGRVDEARTLIDEVLEQQEIPSSSLLQWRAFIAILEGDSGAAFDYYAKSMPAGIDEDLGYGSTGPAQLAQVAQACDRLDSFYAFLEERIAANPHDFTNYRILADTKRNNGDLDGALETLERAAKISSLQLQAMQTRVRWLEQVQDPVDLIVEYEQLLALQDRQVAQARDRYQRSTAEESRERLGELHWEVGNEARALEYWTERADSQSPYEQSQIAERLYDRRAFDRARVYFEDVVSLNPEHTSANRRLAELAWIEQRTDEVLSHLTAFANATQQSAISGSSYSYQRQWKDALGAGGPPSQWALSVLTDPALSSEAALREQRLVLSYLVGAWDDVRRELAVRAEQSPYDPSIWTLSAIVHERSGEWAQAAEAWEFVRRLKRTTLPDHREQLQLALAGRQVREAAGGTRSSGAATAPGVPSSYGGRGGFGVGYGRRGSSDALTQRLASLYVHLDRVEDAERLLLLMPGREFAERISELSLFLWSRDDADVRERALSLMHIATLMGQSSDSIDLYARMLGQARRTDEAIDLLIRAYRYAGSSDVSYGYDFYGGYGRVASSLENGQESDISSALYGILRDTGQINDTLDDLVQQRDTNPTDDSLAKLVVNLQLRDARWTDASESLGNWLDARPDQLDARRELVHVLMQLHEWDDALEHLHVVLASVPDDDAIDLQLQVAFVHLLRHDAASAADVAEVILRDSRADFRSRMSACTILAAAGRYDAILENAPALELAAIASDEGDDGLAEIAEISYRARFALGDYDGAFGIVTRGMWNSGSAMIGADPSFDTLVRWASAVKAEGYEPVRDELSSLDQALLDLLMDGPEAGRAAFAELLNDEPSSLNAHRGLLLATYLSRDFEAAKVINEGLLDLLKTRRHEIMSSPPRIDLAAQMSRQLESWARGDGGTASLLGSGSRSVGGRWLRQTTPQTGNTLYMAHLSLQRELLRWLGETEQLEQNLRLQASLAQRRGRDYRGGFDYDLGFGFDPYADDFSSASRFSDDWEVALLGDLFKAGHFDELGSRFKALGRRMPTSLWSNAAATYVALDDMDAAHAWHVLTRDRSLLELRAGDEPGIISESDSQSRYWASRWYWGYGSDREVDEIRRRLNRPSEWEMDDAPWSYRARRSVARLAASDEEIRDELLSYHDHIDRGWAGTGAFDALVRYYMYIDAPEQVIDLFERAFEDPADIIRSEGLGNYVAACMRANAYDRLDTILEQAVTFSARLKADADVLRLVALRRQGRASEADQLEQSLLAAAPSSTPNPYPLGDEFVRATDSIDSNRGRRGYSYGSQGFGEDLSSAAVLANTLSVRFDETNDDVASIERIRNAYVDHGLYDDAVRLLDEEIDATRTSRSRSTLRRMKIDLLVRATRMQEARAEAERFEADLRSDLKQRPWDVRLHHDLLDLYRSEAYGPASDLAYAQFVAVREIDPSFSVGTWMEFELLHALDRHDEAWAAVGLSLNAGSMGDLGPDLLYRIGTTAHEAGAQREAEQLLRLALWRAPDHAMATTAREILDE